MSDQPTTVHRTPVGCASSVPCCGQHVFDLPHTDRLTTDGDITCGGTATRTDQLAEIRAELGPADWPSEILRLRAELAQARGDVRRLAVAAENGKHSLAAFVSDSSDPGSAALGALYLLGNALAGQPDTEPAYLEITPEALRAAHFREAARLLEDADCDDDAVNLLDNVARGIADVTPAGPCLAEPVHQAGCPAAEEQL